jgi:hypothetical protein
MYLFCDAFIQDRNKNGIELDRESPFLEDF